MIEPMTPEQIGTNGCQLWFIVNHRDPNVKCILSDEETSETLLFATQTLAADYIMEQFPRYSDSYQVVKESF